LDKPSGGTLALMGSVSCFMHTFLNDWIIH
jgi:hypothetical protein